MKKLVAIAALLMATTSAHAGGTGITFQIDGQRIHVEAPRNCSALSCIRISAPGYNGTIGGISKNLGSKSDDDDDVASTSSPSPAPPAAPAPSLAPVQAAAPQPAAAAVPPPPPPPAPPAMVATTAPAPVDAAPAAPAPAPVATQPAPQPQAAPVAVAPAPATGPIGVWATEENKGNVRVEACGTNLCGYSVKSNERILINMKPDGSKWSGRIHDPDSGRNYDSTIAMKGPNAMRVQGCAFGGMFCGGQTWKRVS
ncbi:DUF2147 domain-containing protein [Bradyrhizobium sp. B120]|uniref:DUF2147 domain-containing protein n=1 Tax=Bradyrhizobium sp. B120 TaxID=3410088 RepID=UPI003B984164